jgi:hypothetical protein
MSALSPSRAVGQSGRERQPHGKIAAVEILDRGHALDDGLGPRRRQRSGKSGRDHQDAVLPLLVLFGKSAYRTGHPAICGR